MKMRIQSILLSLILAFSPTALLAGANHDHGHDDKHGHSHDPVNQSQAEKVAKESVAMLVKKEKIDSSWKSVSVASAEKKKFGGKMEWVVTFKNDKISDASKQTLYVFLSLTGNYIAANYTGK
jgi:hypothetical protein